MTDPAAPRNSWPNSIPPDLRKGLESVLGMRSFGAADLWGPIKEWLDAHDVPVPGDRPEGR